MTSTRISFSLLRSTDAPVHSAAGLFDVFDLVRAAAGRYDNRRQSALTTSDYLMSALLNVVQHRLDFIDKIASVFEFAVDAGKAYVGHLVEFAKFVHDEVTKFFAVDFLFHLGSQCNLDAGHDAVDLLVADWPFPARLGQSASKLFRVKFLSNAVFFDDLNIERLQMLIGGESSLAIRTFTTSAHNVTVLNASRVDDTVVVDSAEGATHRIDL